MKVKKAVSGGGPVTPHTLYGLRPKCDLIRETSLLIAQPISLSDITHADKLL